MRDGLIIVNKNIKRDVYRKNGIGKLLYKKRIAVRLSLIFSYYGFVV